MECNKEEAIRAMDIAKRKVTENDYNGAKVFANKAQNLYPQLDGLKQVSMLINVYISAANKITGGESDWYGILGVDPLAEEEVVKKQYKKLALLLHPDKNKCDGAEGAFKLVLEAWSLLSDKVKRIGYDQKRKSKDVRPKKSRKQKQPPNQQKPPPNQAKQPPNQQKPPRNQAKQPPNQQKQSPNKTKQPPSQPKQPPNQAKQPPKQQPDQPKEPTNQPNQQPNQPSSGGSRNGRARSNKPTTKVSTFWTMCNNCKTQHEYVRVFFLNKKVRCQNCHGTFMATEKEKTTAAENEKTPQATNKNTDCASSFGKDSPLNVANQAEEKVKSGGTDSEAARGIAKSDFEVEERVFKKHRTDDYAEASSGIKV